MFDREFAGRIALRELDDYNTTAEMIIAEHEYLKAKRRKDRDAQSYRHRKPENRNSKAERYTMRCRGVECGNSTARNYHAEISIRADFLLEQEAMAEDLRWAEIYAEQERMQSMQILHEWLKYA